MNKKYTNKSSIKLRDEDCEDCYTESNDVLGFTVKQQSFYNFNVHINTEIRSPAYYSKIFDLLLEAGEGDTVSMFISSPGGRLDGLTTLLEGIRLTDAHVTAIITGDASSAASILALNCHDIVICDSAESLIHSCRLGYVGKIADLTAHTIHASKVTEKLMRETYKHFLSPEELQQMLDGKEFYFDADDLRTRLAQRDEALEVEFLVEQEEARALQEQDEPKPKRKKKN